METLISYDLSKPMHEQDSPGHNRWHPDIPPQISVNPGDAFRVDCQEWTDGQVGNNDSANDIRDVQLTRVHVLTGPIAVNGAQPGDLLVVDILDIGTFPGYEWGFNGIFARENGGGFLTDYYPEARKSIWDFYGIYTQSRHIPGVRYAGITHPGLIGVAPSQEMLDEWNRRERGLVDTDPDRVPPLANLPTPENAVLGQMSGSDFDRVASEGARTVPPRENGGNCDIKNLSRGSRAWFPVFVEGGKLSIGDLHFSQGDGEITFCGAIEMPGWVDLQVDLIKDGMNKYGISHPIFQPGPVEPRYSEFLVFEGYSVDEHGNQHYLDTHVAYRQAVLAAIDYLQKLGFTGEQAFMILGTAPVEGRISGIVDIPNACCTLYIPKEIFQGNIMPVQDGPTPFVSGGDVAKTS